MDSLTQIALGAAVGEATLGKKIGNRALLWGAVGGTIPDLDVLSNLFLNDIEALAFHRGITHSLTFAVVVPFLLGFLVHRLYAGGLYRRRAFKWTAALLWWGVYALLSLGVCSFLWRINGAFPSVLGGMFVLGGVFLVWKVYRGYLNKDLAEVGVGYRDWVWLLFWAIVTHPLLDCFTVYGTQFFQPFSDYRVAFNFIAVVDPLYTLPLLLGVIVVSRIRRNPALRKKVIWTGLGLSTAYMAFCWFHKEQMNHRFAAALEEQGISAERCMTSPTILNNFLWQGLAEGDTAYHYGTFTFLAPEKGLSPLVSIPKNRELAQTIASSPEFETLTWFSKGFWNVVERPDGRLQFNDLRFGSLSGDFSNPTDFVFKFVFEPATEGWVVFQTREGSRIDAAAFREFFDRVRGQRPLAEE